MNPYQTPKSELESLESKLTLGKVTNSGKEIFYDIAKFTIYLGLPLALSVMLFSGEENPESSKYLAGAFLVGGATIGFAHGLTNQIKKYL